MYFSGSEIAFFPLSLRKRYENRGAWPSDAVKVSQDSWEEYGLGVPPVGKQLGSDENGMPAWVDLPAGTLDELRRLAVARVNNGYAREMETILVEYPDAETLSFDKQEREAREWQAWHDAAGNNEQGSEPTTPYLDALLAERPIGKGDLVTRILAKADAFVAAHGNATGRRQRLEDDIKAARQAEDRAALEAIDW